MTNPTFDVELPGCHVEPLASYLKALGVMRLVAEQQDPQAGGYWRGEHFVLRSRLDRAALIEFLSLAWRPTPVIAPWNGGSGFYEGDNQKAAEAIVASSDPRLDTLSKSIRIAREYIAKQGWRERPEDEAKEQLLGAMRASLPDAAIAWLDAAVVLGEERPLYPPLLGTGGNDGRFDFSNNFQQRVIEVLTSDTREALESSLLGAAASSRFKGVMGQYQPAAGEKTNPWDFVLLMEGALVFAAAATRRYDSSSQVALAFPFHARAAGGLASVADGDESDSRDELWLPLWSVHATYRDIKRLFGEARATVGLGQHARAASTALDFARAVSALGVDRGLSGFVRVGFHLRNGKAFFATTLGRFDVRDVPSARLYDEIDGWYSRFREKASSAHAPARVACARRQLEQAMFDALVTDRLGPVLMAFGQADCALGRSLGFTAKSFLSPPPRLQASWIDAVDDGTPEQRLAAALALRGGMHARLSPLESASAYGRADQPGFVFADRPLVDNLCQLLVRESLEAAAQPVDRPVSEPRYSPCSLSDIARFIHGDTNDELIERWLRGFALIDGEWTLPAQVADTILPPAAYSVLALAHHRHVRDEELPRTAGLVQLAWAGDARAATRSAISRLTASGHRLPVSSVLESTSRMRRIAAALAFPLTKAQRQTIERTVLPAPLTIRNSEENV